jgi:hypothetical protein
MNGMGFLNSEEQRFFERVNLFAEGRKRTDGKDTFRELIQEKTHLIQGLSIRSDNR